MIVQAQMWHY